MANPNPTCTVNGSATPVDVSASTSTTIALASTAGAVFWSLSCTSTDETSSAATVNAGLVINQGNKTATFTSNAVGSCTIWTSTVGVLGPGLDANGVLQPSLKTTFKVNVKAANGNRVTAVGELGEQGPFGWIPSLNTAAKAVASAATPVFYASLATLVPSSGRAVQDTDGFSAVKDGGQGTWRWSAGDTTPADGGTIAGTTGSGRWFRVFDHGAGFDARWFGAKGDGVTDDSAAIQAAINACGIGGKVKLPNKVPSNVFTNSTTFVTATYAIANSLIVDFNAGAIAITIEGDAGGTQQAGTIQTRLVWSGGIAASGTAASIASAANDQYGVARLVTLSGLSGLAGGTPNTTVNPGDFVTISGATSTDGNGIAVNNGVFPIVSVNAGAGSLVYWCSNIARTKAYTPVASGNPIAPDANNTHITWSCKKNMVNVYGPSVRIKDLTIHGVSAVGACIDWTYGVGVTGQVATNLQLDNVCMINGLVGLQAGGFGKFGLMPSGNNDMGIYTNCLFQCSYAGFYLPNLNGQSKSNDFHQCQWYQGTVGILIGTGSYRIRGAGFQGVGCAIQIIQPYDACSCVDSWTEHCGRLYVQGTGILGFTTNAAPVSFINLRSDASLRSVDNTTGDIALNNGTFPGHYVESSLSGGLAFINCTFNNGVAGYTGLSAMRFAVAGQTGSVPSASVVFQGCCFPNSDQTLPLVSTAALPATWVSLGNYWQYGAGTVQPIKDGIYITPGSSGAASLLVGCSQDGTNLALNTPNAAGVIDLVYGGALEIRNSGGALATWPNADNAWSYGLLGNRWSHVYTADLGVNTIQGNVTGSGTPISYVSTTIAMTTGTVTLSAAQLSCAAQQYTGTLSGNVTIVYPNVAGDWQADFSAVVMGAFTITIQSGSSTSAAIAAGNAGSTASPINQVFTIKTYGSNTVRVSGGSPNLAPTDYNAQSLTVASSGTTTLTAGQQNASILNVPAVTLTGATTIALNGVTGLRYLDLTNITLGAFSLTITNGAGSATVTTLLTTKKLLTINTPTTATIGVG